MLELHLSRAGVGAEMVRDCLCGRHGWVLWCRCILRLEGSVAFSLRSFLLLLLLREHCFMYCVLHAEPILIFQKRGMSRLFSTSCALVEMNLDRFCSSKSQWLVSLSSGFLLIRGRYSGPPELYIAFFRPLPTLSLRSRCLFCNHAFRMPFLKIAASCVSLDRLFPACGSFCYHIHLLGRP
jgi:hypothetical protein